MTPAALAEARQALASIQEANRHEGVLNEHVLHSEIAAAQLVERLGTELAHLKCGGRNMDDGVCGGRTPENNMSVLSIMASKTEHPEGTKIPCKPDKDQ